MNGKKLDAILDHIDNLTRCSAAVAGRLLTLQGIVKKLDERILEIGNANRLSTDRMADRLIEMAMVHRGSAQSASVHRNAARLERPSEMPEATDDAWAETQDDWPPKGHDTLNMP